jgi:mitogen-activated protein kinase kinase kinase
VFVSAGSNAHSPPTIYRVGSGPFNTPSGAGPSTLDDLRKRLVKFVIPDEGLSFTIDVASCTGGVEVVEKVLKKFVKNTHRTDTSDVSQTEDGGLAVDGWGVYPDLGQGDSPG